MTSDGTLKSLKKGRPSGPDAASELRIEEIAQTLRDGTFRNGTTLQAFADRWGVTLHRVHELSGAASKKVRAEITDPDRVAAKGYAYLERIADDAMDGDAMDRKLALAAVDTWLTKSGVAAPAKSAVHVTGDLTTLTDEQLDARKKDLIARLTKP